MLYMPFVNVPEKNLERHKFNNSYLVTLAIKLVKFKHK